MDERVAVITGGSSGIGAELARLLCRDGWTCVLVARGEERLRALAEEVGAEAEVCDVGDRAAVDELARRVTERHPRIKLLVNNAGVPARADFIAGEAERIEAVARICGRTRSWVMVRAMKAYLASEGRDILDLDAARRAAAEEGATELDDLLTKMERILPGDAA